MDTNIHKECRISQYMFHIQKITGPLSLYQLEQFKDLSEIQEIKISAADTDRLAQQIRTGNWNNNKVKQTVSYNTWVTPCFNNVCHETEAEKLLKATTILQELLPKYVCPNHKAEDPKDTTNLQATNTNVGNLNTVDVTKLKQLMRRAVEKLPDSSILDVEEFMMICLEEFDAENQKEEDEKQAWGSHRKIPTENETYDEHFEKKMTSVITATLNACSRRLRKIERTQVVIKPKTKTNKPCVSYKEPDDVSYGFPEHGNKEIHEDPTTNQQNSKATETHKYQDNEESKRHKEHDDKAKMQQLEKLYRKYKEHKASESSYPSRFSYYLPEGAVPKNWTVNAQPDDYLDDHYFREKLVVPRLDLGFTVYEKPDLSHHTTYSSYWSKSLSSEGSFREWLNKKGVKNYKAENDLHMGDEKKPGRLYSTNKKLTTDELKAMEPSTTESCEGTFSLDRSFVSLMEKQKDRTGSWVDDAFSDTKLMQEYGSDIFDSIDQSEHSAASTCTTDWTSLTNRKSNRSETNPLVAENPRRDVTRVEHPCHQNVEPVYRYQPLSQADKELFARELSDIAEESSYQNAAQEAYSWSDISVFSRDGDYVYVSARSNSEEGNNVVNRALSDISVLSRSRDGYTSFNGGNVDDELNERKRDIHDQEIWIPCNHAEDASSTKIRQQSDILPFNQQRARNQEGDTYDTRLDAETPTLAVMYGHNYTSRSNEGNDNVTGPDYANKMVTQFAESNVPMCNDVDGKSDIRWEDLHLELDSPVQSGINLYKISKNRTSEVGDRNVESQLYSQINNYAHVGLETMSRDSHVSLASIEAVAGENVDALSVQSSYGSWHSEGQEEFDESKLNYRKLAYRRGEYNIAPEDLPMQFLPDPDELPQVQTEINIKFESRNTKLQSSTSTSDLLMESKSQMSVTPIVRTPQKSDIKGESPQNQSSMKNSITTIKISPTCPANVDKVYKKEPENNQGQNLAADISDSKMKSKMAKHKQKETEPNDEVLEIISLNSELSDTSAVHNVNKSRTALDGLATKNVTSNTSQGSHNSTLEEVGFFKKAQRKELPNNIAVHTQAKSSLPRDANEILVVKRSSPTHAIEAIEIKSFTSNSSNNTEKSKIDEKVFETSNHQNEVCVKILSQRMDTMKSDKKVTSNTSQGSHKSSSSDFFKMVQRKQLQSNTAWDIHSQKGEAEDANDKPEVSISSHDNTVEVMKIESFTSSHDTAKTKSDENIVEKSSNQNDVKGKVFTNRMDAMRSVKKVTSETRHGSHKSASENVDFFQKAQRKQHHNTIALHAQSQTSQDGDAYEIPEMSRSSHDHSVEAMKIESFTSNSSHDTAKVDLNMVETFNNQNDVKSQTFADRNDPMKSAKIITSNLSQVSTLKEVGFFQKVQKVQRNELQNNIELGTHSQNSQAGDTNGKPEVSRSSHDHSLEVMKIESFTSNTSNDTAKSKSEEKIVEKSSHHNDVKGKVFTNRIEAMKSKPMMKNSGHDEKDEGHNVLTEIKTDDKDENDYDKEANESPWDSDEDENDDDDREANESPWDSDEDDNDNDDKGANQSPLDSDVDNNVDDDKEGNESPLNSDKDDNVDSDKEANESPWDSDEDDDVDDKEKLEKDEEDNNGEDTDDEEGNKNHQTDDSLKEAESRQPSEEKLNGEIESKTDVPKADEKEAEETADDSSWDSEEENENDENLVYEENDSKNIERDQTMQNETTSVTIEQAIKTEDVECKLSLKTGSTENIDTPMSSDHEDDDNDDDKSDNTTGSNSEGSDHEDDDDDKSDNTTGSNSEGGDHEDDDDDAKSDNSSGLNSEGGDHEDDNDAESDNSSGSKSDGGDHEDDNNAKSDNSSGWDSEGGDDSDCNNYDKAAENIELDKNVPQKVKSHDYVESSPKIQRSDSSTEDKPEPLIQNTDTTGAQNITEILYNGALVIKDSGGCDETSDECSVIDMPPDEKKKWMERQATQRNKEGYRALDVDFLNLNDIIEANIPSGGDRELAKAKFLSAIADASYVESIEPESSNQSNLHHEDRPKSIDPKVEMRKVDHQGKVQVCNEPLMLKKTVLGDISGPKAEMKIEQALAEPFPIKKNCLAPIRDAKTEIRKTSHADVEPVPVQKKGLTPIYDPIPDIRKVEHGGKVQAYTEPFPLKKKGGLIAISDPIPEMKKIGHAHVEPIPLQKKSISPFYEAIPEIRKVEQNGKVQVKAEPFPLKNKGPLPIQPATFNLQPHLQLRGPSTAGPLLKPHKLEPLPLNALGNPLQRQGLLRPLAPINALSPTKKVKSPKKENKKSKKKEKVKKVAEKERHKEVVPEPRRSSSTETFSAPSYDEAELGEMLRMDGRSDSRDKITPNKMLKRNMNHSTEFNTVLNSMTDDFAPNDYGAHQETIYRSATRTVGRMEDDFMENSYDSSDSDVPQRNVNYNSKKNNF